MKVDTRFLPTCRPPDSGLRRPAAKGPLDIPPKVAAPTIPPKVAAPTKTPTAAGGGGAAGGGAAGGGGFADNGKTYVRDVTAVSPLALLLFGGDVQVHHDKGTVTIDKEIAFEAPGRVAVLVRELRASLDKLLRDKIAQPALEIGGHPVLAAIVNLITTERAGFS